MEASLWRRINMHRDHRWAQSRMSAYLDGELDGGDRRRLSAHTSICPECRRVLGTLRRMISALGGIGGPQPPPAERVAGGVIARIEDEPLT